jgi:hypothetical protein
MLKTVDKCRNRWYLFFNFLAAHEAYLGSDESNTLVEAGCTSLLFIDY